MCFMHAYIHIYIYPQEVFWVCCHIYDQNSVRDTKFEFIIAGRWDNLLIYILYLHQCIYPFHISVVFVFYDIHCRVIFKKALK